ncbi:MAG: hypothetical protein AAGB34_06925, partial [Planctomycetota bacterium]
MISTPSWWRWWMRPIAVSVAAAALGLAAVLYASASSRSPQSGYTDSFVMMLGLAFVLSCLHIGGALGGRRGLIYAILIPIGFLFILFGAIESVANAIAPLAVVFAALAVGYAIHRFSLRLAAVIAALSYALLFFLPAWDAYPQLLSSRFPALLLSLLGGLLGSLAVAAPEGTSLHYLRSLPIKQRFLITRKWRYEQAHTSAIEQGADERVAGTIASVVASLNLWETEIRSVTNELLAHFADAIKGNQPVDEAIRSFGDPKVAARLATRAKKRCRPPLWRAWMWSLRGSALVFALLLTAYSYNGVRFWTAKPNIAIDYLEILMKPIEVMPEANRGWREWIEVWGKLPVDAKVTYKDEDNLEDFVGVIDYNRLQGDTPDDHWAEYQKLVRQEIPLTAAAIRELAQRKPQLGWPYSTTGSPPEYGQMLEDRDGTDPSKLWGQGDDEDAFYGSLIGVLLPNLSEQRNCVRVLAADMHLAIEDKNPTLYLENLEAMFVIAQQAF